MASRSKNSFLNIGTNVVTLMAKTILTFITRTIFIWILGKEALGLNGLFTNILSMLSLAELGVGTAINFSLYKPLAQNNQKKIDALMSFYKKAYRIIGLIIIVVGIIIVPFLGFFIKNINEIKDVYLIYFLYLFNTASTYFISYKETLINADQKKYKLYKIELISLVVLNVIQIVILYITKNFIAYLITQFFVTFIQRIWTNIYIGKIYKNVNFNSSDRIDKDDKNVIVKNVKAMFFHKIGDYCVNSTDNLIISSFIDIYMVGIYSNYLTIITLLNNFTYMIFNNLTASLGNLVAIEGQEKKEDIFKKMNFIGYILFGFCSLMLLNLFNDFIKIWIGNDFCLNFVVVIFIVLNFYLTGMRIPSATMKSAAGLYDVDKFTPLIQSVVNLIVSIILAQKIGLLGVIIGTAISSILLPNWQRPYLVYKHVIKKSSKDYFKNLILFTIFICLLSICTISINSFIKLNNNIVTFIFKSISTTVGFTIGIIICYRKTEEYNYFKDIVKKICMKLCKKGAKNEI